MNGDHDGRVIERWPAGPQEGGGTVKGWRSDGVVRIADGGAGPPALGTYREDAIRWRPCCRSRAGKTRFNDEFSSSGSI
jgi:hypothetical protein